MSKIKMDSHNFSRSGLVSKYILKMFGVKENFKNFQENI